MNIYCDSGYSWSKTINGKGEGVICIYIDKKKPEIVIENVIIQAEPELKQLNNRFELMAIQIALDKAKKYKKFKIFSDSKVAVGWSKRFSILKDNNVYWIPRENNKAGIVLENK